MILTLIAVLGVAALLITFWNDIREFLNTVVRDFLEKIFGAGKCSWFVNFVQWCDHKITPIRRVVKMQWKKFRDTILRVNSIYEKNDDGTYTKKTETIVRASPTTAKRQIVEETIGWEYLPAAVRDEMLARRTKQAELDERELVAEKVRQRAEEDGIELSA